MYIGGVILLPSRMNLLLSPLYLVYLISSISHIHTSTPTPTMSRKQAHPPSSYYPPQPRNLEPLPPFPQLLHRTDETPTSTAGSHINTTNHRASTASTPDKPNIQSDDDDGDGSHFASPGAMGSRPSGGTGGADPKHRKPHAARRRVVQSCSECRRRKIKCDKKSVHIYLYHPVVRTEEGNH